MLRPAFRLAAAAYLAAFVLAGCDSSAVKVAKAAERRAQMVDQSYGTAAERCEARREVAQAWLLAEDQGKYDKAKLDAALACNAAALDHLATD